MSNKEQKIESLGHLEAWLNDALNSGATSKEVYDTIANTIKNEIKYHEKCLKRSQELLLMVKGNLSVLDTTVPPIDSQLFASSRVTEAVTQKDWEDFWSPSSDEELDQVDEIIKKEGYEYTPPTSHNRVTHLPTRY